MMHQTLEAFSDRGAMGDNALTRTDARIKLALALAAIVAVLLSGRILLPLALFAACVLVSLTLRVPPKMLLWRVAGPLGIAVVMGLLRSAMPGGTPVLSVPLGHWSVTFSREGLNEGFKFKNPNVKDECGCGESFTV